MKKTLSMLLVAMLVTSPAFAMAPDESSSLRAAAAEAAEAYIAAAAEAGTLPPVQEMGGEKNTGKILLGIGLIGAAVALVLQGNSLKQEEPDIFGRSMDNDVYSMYVLGGVVGVIGAVILKGEMGKD